MYTSHNRYEWTYGVIDTTVDYLYLTALYILRIRPDLLHVLLLKHAQEKGFVTLTMIINF